MTRKTASRIERDLKSDGRLRYTLRGYQISQLHDTRINEVYHKCNKSNDLH